MAGVLASLLAAVCLAILSAQPAGAASPDGPRAADGSRSAALPPPGISPPGANDFSCEGRRERRTPVVLVHGTFGDMTVSWNLISPALARGGWCVFALDLPRRATVRVQRSARKLGRFVDRVRRATGRQRVSIVGHSQGGMLPRYYVKRLGGRSKVRDLIGLSPSNHGTTNPLAPPAGLFCPACRQQVRGSLFLRRLNRGSEVPGRRIDYTVVQTVYDEVVTPYQSAFLDGSRRRLTNVTLQDRCPLDTAEHLRIIYDRVALQWVRNALDRPGPADPRFRPSC